MLKLLKMNYMFSGNLSSSVLICRIIVSCGLLVVLVSVL